MARKHNGRHPERGRSKYRDRLARRSTRDVLMAPVEDLRKTQAARSARHGHWWPTSLTDHVEDVTGGAL